MQQQDQNYTTLKQLTQNQNKHKLLVPKCHWHSTVRKSINIPMAIKPCQNVLSHRRFRDESYTNFCEYNDNIPMYNMDKDE